MKLVLSFLVPWKCSEERLSKSFETSKYYFHVVVLTLLSASPTGEYEITTPTKTISACCHYCATTIGLLHNERIAQSHAQIGVSLNHFSHPHNPLHFWFLLIMLPLNLHQFSLHQSPFFTFFLEFVRALFPLPGSLTLGTIMVVNSFALVVTATTCWPKVLLSSITAPRCSTEVTNHHLLFRLAAVKQSYRTI